jgi:hypothetical protein
MLQNENDAARAAGTDQRLTDTIDEVIHSMGWDLDQGERDDMRALCQRLADRLKGDPGQALTSGTDREPPHLNGWFLSLEPQRQAVLREDKWMLADAAFRAGFNLGAGEATATPTTRSPLIDIMREALETLAVAEMGEPSLFAREYERQTREIARNALRELQATQVGERVGLCPQCERDGRCMKRMALCKAGALAKANPGAAENLPADIETIVQAMLDLDPYDPHAPLTSRRQFCAFLARAGFRRQGEGEHTLRAVIERNVRYVDNQGHLLVDRLGAELATLLGLDILRD